MKVLVVGPPPAIGGTEIFLKRIIPQLRERGIAVTEFSVRSAVDVCDTCREIDRVRPDIIHFFLPRPYIIGSLAAAASRHKCRLVMSRRSLRDCYRNHWIEQAFHSRVDAFVGNSTAVVDELRAETGREPVLIHNGVDPHPTTCHKGITCLADNRPYKGRRDFVAALEILKDKLPNSPPDIFVLPSHTEGFSNALLEAMAMALPCIATCVGGNLDAIEHNCSGILVAPHRPLEIADAIHELAWDRSLRERLGAAARQRVRDNFSLETCVDKHVDLYNRVLQ